MPDRKDELETRSSDSFIKRDLEQQENEYYAKTGKKITISPIRQSGLLNQIDILKPGSYTDSHAPVEEVPPVETGGVMIDFNNFKENASNVGRSIVADRQKRKAA